MADNNQRLTEQFQAFVQRWQTLMAHPVQSLADWVTPRFRPGAHQQFVDVNSEVALNPAALAERRGQGADITRLTSQFRDEATAIRAEAAEKSRANDTALHDETQAFAAAPQRDERSPGPGALQENWERPGSYDGIRQESEIGAEFYPLREERASPRDQSTTLDTIEAMHQRVQQLSPPAQRQERSRDQGMGM